MDEETKDLFEGYLLLKQERDDAEAKFRSVQNRLIEIFTLNQRKSATYSGRKFTMVAGERTVIDEDGLKKGMGAKAWNKFTIKKLDRSKLESALLDGSVDPVLVARHSVVKKDTPHIRVSSVEQE